MASSLRARRMLASSPVHVDRDRPLYADRGQLRYDPARHSGPSVRVSAIA